MHATRRSVQSAIIQLARTTRTSPTSSILLRQVSAARGLPRRIGAGGGAPAVAATGVRYLSGTAARCGLKADDSERERRGTQQKGGEGSGRAVSDGAVREGSEAVDAEGSGGNGGASGAAGVGTSSSMKGVSENPTTANAEKSTITPAITSMTATTSSPQPPPPSTSTSTAEPQTQPKTDGAATPTTEKSSADKPQQQHTQSQTREPKPRGRPSGSSKRRNVTPKPKVKEEEDTSKAVVPEWFLKSNVLLVEQNLRKATNLECWVVPKGGEESQELLKKVDGMEKDAVEGTEKVDGVEGEIQASAQEGAEAEAVESEEVVVVGEETTKDEGAVEEVVASTVEKTTEITTIEKLTTDATATAAESEPTIVTETEIEDKTRSESAIVSTLETEESPVLDRAASPTPPDPDKVLIVSLSVNKAMYIDGNLSGSFEDIARAGKLTLVTPSGTPVTSDCKLADPEPDSQAPETEAEAPTSPEATSEITASGPTEPEMPEKKPTATGDEDESLDECLDRLLRESGERGAIKGTRYATHVYVWREISAYVAAGLALPKESFQDSAVALKSHVVLRCPREGGLYHLDTVVEHIAALSRADLVKIDAQDLEEIAGDYLGDSKYFSLSSISSQAIRSLGYDAQLQNNSPPKEEPEEEQEEEETEEDIDEETESTSSYNIPSPASSSPLQIRQLMANGYKAAIVMVPDGVNSGLGGMEGGRPSMESLDSDRKNEKKLAVLLDALIGSAATKRKLKGIPPYQDPWAAKDPEWSTESESSSVVEGEGSGVAESASSVSSSVKEMKQAQAKTIIHIQDYSQLQRTSQGATILRMMHELVATRRKRGEQILVVGTTAGDESPDSLQTRNFQALQELQDDSVERTIIVPPMEDLDLYEFDRKARVREVNIRHLRDLIRRRSGSGEDSIELEIPAGWHYLAAVSEEDPKIPGVDEDVWTFDRTHRIANMVIGMYHKSFVSHLSDEAEKKFVRGKVTVRNVVEAVKAIEESDEFKLEWAAAERKRLLAKEKEEEEGAGGGVVEGEEGKGKVGSVGTLAGGGGGSSALGTAELLKKLNKTCTPHEKKLLAGVINPDKLHVGFNSIRAPTETIESLRTLTSLSLVRPDAFQYGVLATDRIPGVLLYGPPGTGKTLLAKAVAKESGATVLEVSGSEIFDMYVGEGEKNVKAIFSLAQKLSPCIVFIDEADAIFGARSSSTSRNTHREIINQFLKEWADFAHSSAFIMVATNRPFDLDDAVLRRLPRRILVDLPTQLDRLEILRIHLRDEMLAPDVDLEALAQRTRLYSGSDLKNVCVSAALTCVKEERRDAGGRFPARRRLEARHFEKAVAEIAASVGEDMASLAAIRKFDEKFGEGKGRGKRTGGWGFGADVAGGKEVVVKGEGRVRRGV